MKCKDFAGMVPAFLDDSLDDTSLRAFLDHYDRCKGCKEELEIQFLVNKVFNEMEVTDGINLEKDLPEFVNRERKLLHYRMRLGNAAAILEMSAVVAVILMTVLFLS